MGVKNKLKMFRERLSSVGKEKVETNPNWIPNQPKSGVKTVKFTIPKPKRVYHIPYLRGVKRLLAFIILVMNFVSGVYAFQSGFMSIIFFVESFLLLDYLWKTRLKND